MAVRLQDFDGREIQWKTFGSYTGFSYRLLNVDLKRKVIDLLFQFGANQRCFYHRHYHPTSTFVLQGEQHIFEPRAGGIENHKVRIKGQFAISEGVETHIEGGGPGGCIIYQNVRAESDLVYSILNDDLSTKIDISIKDFRDDFLQSTT